MHHEPQPNRGSNTCGLQCLTSSMPSHVTCCSDCSVEHAWQGITGKMSTAEKLIMDNGCSNCQAALIQLWVIMNRYVGSGSVMLGYQALELRLNLLSRRANFESLRLLVHIVPSSCQNLTWTTDPGRTTCNQHN